MSKFNSFASAVLCFAVVSSAGASDFKSPVSAVERFNEQSKATAETVLPANTGIRKTQAKATRDEVCGHYNFDSYRLTRTFQGWERTYCMPVVAPGESDDDLILYGFWADFNSDGTPISAVKAKFDYEKQQIIIPAGASLGTYGDYSAYIYVSDWDTDKMLDEPIVLNYDAANKGMTYYCEPNAAGTSPKSCLIVTSYADAVGTVVTKGVDFIGAIEMYKYNGTMSLNDATHSTSGQCLVYIESSTESFAVRNFGNRGFRIPIEFTFNLSGGTCTAQPTICHKDYKFDDGNIMDLYFAGADGGAITGTLEKQAADSNMYTVHIPTWTLFNVEEGKSKVEFKNSYLSVPIEGNSGVETAITETHDAPVEFYTLQGVRVVNPEKGTLVIKRQGDKVSKIVVR